MNELKSVYIDRTGDWVRSGTNTGNFYLKSEVDKVIAHQKYRRCLAMAERCKFRMYYLSTIVDYELSKLIPNPTAVKRYTKKESRMDYWKNRWLELAEQFKEAE